MITNVAIRTKSPELVDFFYPNFVRTDVFSPFLKGVIFTGDSKYLQSFRDAKIPYIYVKGTPEYDLTIPENLFKFVYGKWNKEPPIYLLTKFKGIDKVNTEMEDIAKLVWVKGSYKSEEEEEKKLEGLYSLMSRGSSYDILRALINASEYINSDKLIYYIQRFLKDSKEPERARSVYMIRLLKSFVTRRRNIEPAIMQYLYSPVESDMLKIMILLDRLSKMEYK